jgi:hypothetical protein
MKKNNTCQQNPKRRTKNRSGSLTIGMDRGDKTSRYCMLDQQGEIVQEGSVGTTKKALAQKFGSLRRSWMAVEVGTHSPWVSQLLATLGHEVIVANARQVKLISQSSRKDDRLDAQTLARLARVDPQLRFAAKGDTLLAGEAGKTTINSDLGVELYAVIMAGFPGMPARTTGGGQTARCENWNEARRGPLPSRTTANCVRDPGP